MIESPNRQRDAPILLCCYHKVGTVLLFKVFRSLCEELGWRMRFVLGLAHEVPADADVVIFAHSLVEWDSVDPPYTGAHFIRDPRDVIVSGYLYHRRCQEKWCTNRNLDPTAPIEPPRVPFSQRHRPESWKQQYLASLDGKSYQDNLRQRDASDGLLFEMRHYGAWTIESMLAWNYANPRLLEVKFESLMSDYDATFEKLFEWFGLSGQQVAVAMRIVAKEDLRRMTDAELRKVGHVASRDTTRWRKYFQDVHKQAFKRQFGDALIRLGYETSNDW